MNNYYDYVSPDYKIRFGMSGDWFKFETDGRTDKRLERVCEALCGGLK